MNYSTEKSRKRHAKEPLNKSELLTISCCLDIVLQDYPCNIVFRDDIIRAAAKIEYQRSL